MHPKNLHQKRYNFQELIQTSPDLKIHVIPSRQGDYTIDFDNPASVRALNKAILQHFYGIKNWDIPPRFLCPPIPGRADYIHHLSDLFEGKTSLRGLDIGVGANCIYPLIGHKTYGWTFVGTDIEIEALQSAEKIIKANQLEDSIELRLQASPLKIFDGIIKDGERFDFSLCNPPFHGSEKEAREGTERKRKNLGLKQKDKLNFGGRSNELWCEGGERSFVAQMIRESAERPESVVWYTSLVSKEANLPFLEKQLQQVHCPDVKVLNLALGQKKSRILAWSFIS